MQIGFEGLIILSSIVIISYFAYQTVFADHLEKVRSTVDNREYLVQENDDAEDAANLMAEIRRRLVLLAEHLYKAFPDDERVVLLKSNFDANAFREGLEGSGYTSYSLNKGEKIILCLRNKNKLMDINTMMFVSIHELAHLANATVGHDDAFWNTNRWLLEEAINIGIYVKQEFDKEPVDYCNITITSTPLHS
jgi:hypothetical protein